MNKVKLSIAVFKRLDTDEIYEGFQYTNGAEEWWELIKLTKSDEEKQEEKEINEAIEELNLPE